MNRYLLFYYDYYYPSGPQGDMVGSFDNLEEALNKGKKLRGESTGHDYVEHVSDYRDYNGNYEILDLEERRWC